MSVQRFVVIDAGVEWRMRECGSVATRRRSEGQRRLTSKGAAPNVISTNTGWPRISLIHGSIHNTPILHLT
jgi:hypothetical protein